MATQTTIKIESILNWSEPKRVETRNGPRMLSKATPDSKFWDLWRSAKTQLKEAGVSVTKDGPAWTAMWWQPLRDEAKREFERAQEASRATDVDVEIPKPDGLDYLPFQRAGIVYALRVFGELT